MSRVIQISILGKISGNVNADGVIGNRITLKKMYSSDGEVLPFVSARAVKYAIRQAFRERGGFRIDPFYEDPNATEALRLRDSGRPDQYVDNDLFGYMLTTGGRRGKGETFRRHAPVALSYFKALKDTPIKSEFAARFPRPREEKSESEESNPVPFEVEVADFIGRLDVILYDYIGNFTKSTRLVKAVEVKELGRVQKIERLSAFLEILLTPSYVLPRRTNSLNIPEYYAALIYMSDRGPAPIYQYLNYVHSDKGVSIDPNMLKMMMSREEIRRGDKGHTETCIIDYGNYVDAPPEGANKITIKEAIDKACNFLIPIKQQLG